MKTAAVYTLGCKVNQYEADVMKEMFQQRGYRIVPFHDPADVYVVHSCAVTVAAERKTRQMIRRAHRQNPSAKIVVSGCYAQVGKEALQEMPEVDLMLGTHRRREVVDMVESLAAGQGICAVGDIMQIHEYEEMPLHLGSERTRAFLKIQEGCNQFCSYCMVPYARGPIRSRNIDRIEEEALRLSEAGYQEIVLTGVNLGLYGLDRQDGSCLRTVLERIHPLKHLKRIRISSIEPTEVTGDLLDAVCDLGKVCRHFHIPLQSGDDVILQRMNRRYRSVDFLKVVESIRTRFPRAGISTDVIVGFPGESDAQFENTRRVVREAAFSRTHVFSYSPRPGTPAATMPNPVPGPVKDERSRILHEQAATQSLAFHQSFLGETVQVLAEKADAQTGSQEGLTGEYIRVMFTPGSDELTGEMVSVHLTDAHTEFMGGVRV